MIDDFVVLQGKDAESNDHLTFAVAGDNDIWMHAAGYAGSHVVVKIDKSFPTADLIKKAATLAAIHSKATKKSIKVVYCERKHVSKKRGMEPGEVMVDYKHADEIIVHI